MRQAIVTLKKGEGRLLKSGGAWIFDNEIDSIMGEFENGDIVIVHDFDGYGMGRGFINMNSKIRIRMMTRKQDQEIDHAFLEMRVRDAWEYRKKTVDTSSCRVIFGEADFLPGLVIDKFSDVLVVESLALGIDRMKEEIVDILKEVLSEDGITIRGVYERSDAKVRQNEGMERVKGFIGEEIVDILKEVLSEDGITIRGVYERSDAKVRQNEGMERVKGFIGEEFDTKVEIVENGVRYMVDVKDGQKTGFFLDQKYNRLAIQRLCKDAEVLDCFTHTGSFALNAGIAGAKHVTGVDASELGIEQARENARLNGLEDRVEFVCADVFDLLPKLEEEGKQYDVVILDPPAFTKSRKTIKNATKGYREINMRGMKLVKPGGYLATCSCSHFMDYELFTKTIHQAAQNVHKRIRQVEYRTQAPDHPILWSAEESYYLKFYVFQIVDEK